MLPCFAEEGRCARKMWCPTTKVKTPLGGVRFPSCVLHVWTLGPSLQLSPLPPPCWDLWTQQYEQTRWFRSPFFLSPALLRRTASPTHTVRGFQCRRHSCKLFFTTELQGSNLQQRGNGKQLDLFFLPALLFAKQTTLPRPRSQSSRGAHWWRLAGRYKAKQSLVQQSPIHQTSCDGELFWIHLALYFNSPSLFLTRSSFLVAHSTVTCTSAKLSFMLISMQVICKDFNSRSRWGRTGGTASSSHNGTFHVCHQATTTF